MRKLFLLAAWAAFVSATACADDAKKSDDAKKAETKKNDTKKPTTAAEVKASYTKEMTKWQRDYVSADAEEKKKLMEMRAEIISGHGKQALDVAKADFKGPEAPEALMLAMQMGGSAIKKEAREALVKNCLDNDKLAEHLGMMARMEKGEDFLKECAEKSKSKNVQGVAKYSLIASKIENIEEENPKNATEALAKIKTELESVVKDYGDIKVGGRKPSTIKDSAEKQLFFLDNLTVGKVLPDVETENLDGKKVKISDYRGKVVVLDIWATWCGPCRQMIPHERETVSARKDKPFTLISVSADAKKETLTKFLEKEEMPWTHWWDGQGGKLVEKYQVGFYPTIYVLDTKGVIRFKHVRGEAMDKAIDTLLKEAEGRKGGQ